MFLAYGFDIALCLRVISAGNHQLRVGNLFCDLLERVDYQFQPLVGAPFSERQDAVNRIPPSCKVWKLRTVSENAMGSYMHVVAAISLVQDFSIAGH
jgi:hypothetical protein